MSARRLAAVAVIVIIAGCNSDTPTTPASAHRPAFGHATASFTLPVQFPTGIAWNGGTLLYLSTGSGFRETHLIDRLSQMDVGAIPTGGNPRDVAFYGANLLFSDLSNLVQERTTTGTFVNSFALPFRGGGIATDGDTIWVGDIDANRLVITADYGATFAIAPSAVRIEGLTHDPSTHTLWAITPWAGDDNMYELTASGALIRTCHINYEPGIYGLGGIALVADSFYVAMPRGGDPVGGTTILVFSKADLACTPALVQAVNLRMTPRTIHPHANGVVRVAVLTDASFDAATVDVSSVRFGPGNAAAIGSMMQDVGGDGDLDLVLTFLKQDIGIQCGMTMVELTGTTNGGQQIEGSHAIQVVGSCP